MPKRNNKILIKIVEDWRNRERDLDDMELESRCLN